jgi:glutaminyl-peptide cyclotransferase
MNRKLRKYFPVEISLFLSLFLSACLRAPIQVMATPVIDLTPTLVVISPTSTSEPQVANTPSVTPTPAATTSRYSFEVINTYPHDPQAFTEGLCYHDGFLYESTGLIGESSLRKVDLETGSVLQEINLDSQYFGEGMAIIDDQIIQLTWKSNVGFVYNLETFDLFKEFDYSTEGWGLTFDGTSLIMSDGTSFIHFIDPVDFQETAQVQVLDGGVPVTQINELEYFEGEIYANIWQTDFIAIIDPQTGIVTGWIDLTGILNRGGYNQPIDVLNGIAYDPGEKRLFVTGKYWPKLFEIRLLPIE